MGSVCVEVQNNPKPEHMYKRLNSFCAEKYRSAIIPTKIGENKAAQADALKTSPISNPLNPIVDRYVPNVTYQVPQAKYCKNIRAESRILTFVFITNQQLLGLLCHYVEF